jgi:hypothetical protein
MCRDLTFNLRDDVCFRFVLNGDHFLLLKAVTPDCIYVLLQRPIGATKPIEQGARSGHYFFLLNILLATICMLATCSTYFILPHMLIWKLHFLYVRIAGPN